MSGDLDPISGTLRVPASTSWQAIESWLEPQGFTLGPIPGWLHTVTVAQSLGQPWVQRPSPRYGALRENTLAVVADLPNGRTHAVVTPRRATGPDLPRVSFGSHGRGGRIHEVVLQVWPVPSTHLSISAMFSDWDRARTGALQALQSGIRPALWCLRAEARRVCLNALFWGDSTLAEGVARFGRGLSAMIDDGAFFADVLSGDTAVRCPRRGYRDRDWLLAISDEDEVWDLRPEGVTLYGTADVNTASQSDEWTLLADRLYAAVQGEERR